MAIAVAVGRVLLAAVFVTAAVAKLRDLPGSRRAMEDFGVPVRLARALGTLLPIAELAVALALAVDEAAALGALAALALLLAFSVAIAWNLARGRSPDCHCFGQLHSARTSWRTVARNLGLAAIACGVAAGLGAEELAATVAAAGVASLLPALVLSVRRGVGPGRAEDLRSGLAVGSTAPGFELPALGGGTHTVESLTDPGLPLMLIFSDPHCGPCQALAPEVARWQREQADELTIAVVERPDGLPEGAPDPHGRANVLLEDDGHVAQAYGAIGTPTAVLVSPAGEVASAVAGGAVEIEALIPRAGEGWQPLRRRAILTSPVQRRELLVRGAGAWAATSTVLASPLRAMARVAPGRRPRVANPRCNDRFDCPNGERFVDCVGGRCECGFDGYTYCSHDEADEQHCFDLQRDPDHCGRCNNPCTGAPAGRDRCCEGECGVAGLTRCFCGTRRDGRECGPNEVCHPGLPEEGVPPGCIDCADVGRQRCGNDCGDPRTQRCCGGKLYNKADLGPGNWRCCGPPNNRRLVNTDADVRHCGGCNPCARGEVCYQGKCLKKCPQGRKRCGDTCGNPRREYCCNGRLTSIEESQSDPTRCGPTCDKCNSTFPDCCNGDCVNTGFDSRHCGRCNHECPAGCQCAAGGGRPCTGACPTCPCGCDNPPPECF